MDINAKLTNLIDKIENEELKIQFTSIICGIARYDLPEFDFELHGDKPVGKEIDLIFNYETHSVCFWLKENRNESCYSVIYPLDKGSKRGYLFRKDSKWIEDCFECNMEPK